MSSTVEADKNRDSDAHDDHAPEREHRGAQTTRDVWSHVMFSTYGTWLRGDARGFRDHDHRIHSSGDYHHPPPITEHAGLRRWVLRHMHKSPVVLTPALRERAGLALRKVLEDRSDSLLAIAVSGDHVHVLAKLDPATARHDVGQAKRLASLALSADIPGQIWGKRCLLKQNRDREHQTRTFRYIEAHRQEGAWVWTFRDGK